jgi:calcineurin-like phosphoesterase
LSQLVKGGKYIFGWTQIGKDGRTKIPDEAFKEYKLFQDDKVIIMSGSKTSGGFGLTSKRLLENSQIGNNLNKYPNLNHFNIFEGEVILIKKKSYCWVKMEKSGIVNLSKKILQSFNLNYNQLLLVGRGSGLALAFISKGLIYKEAKKHPELNVY